jgi:hypothetical protein
VIPFSYTALHRLLCLPNRHHSHPHETHILVLLELPERSLNPLALTCRQEISPLWAVHIGHQIHIPTFHTPSDSNRTVTSAYSGTVGSMPSHNLTNKQQKRPVLRIWAQKDEESPQRFEVPWAWGTDEQLAQNIPQDSKRQQIVELGERRFGHETKFEPSERPRCTMCPGYDCTSESQRPAA